MSARAACRLETLGFAEVYDYAAGKVDWLVRRRPVEGSRSGDATVGDVARDDAVTCGLDDRVGEIRDRIAGSPYPFALVLGERRVVLGRVGESSLEGDGEERVEARMEPGPSTVRPHKTAASVADNLADKDLRWTIVTSPEGELIGVAARAELEAAIRAQE